MLTVVIVSKTLEYKVNMGGAGSTRETIINATNTMIASAFIKVSEVCQTNLDFQQNTEIHCNPKLDIYEGDISVYEENPACRHCIEDVEKSQLQRYAMLRNKWARGGKVSIPVSYNQEFKVMYRALQSCVRTCKACVFSNASQLENVTWKADCTFNSELKTAFTNSIQSNITQALTDNQDVLSSMAQALGASDKQQTVANIMSRLKVNINESFITSITSNVHNIQNISITNTGVQGATQFNSISGIAHLVSKTNIVNNALSDNEWKVFQDLNNNENTVGQLGNTLKNTVLGLGDVYKNLVGKLLIGLSVIMGVVVLVVMIVAIVTAAKHGHSSPRTKTS